MIIFLNNYNINWCFHFWRILFVKTNPLFMSLWLFDFFPYMHLFISAKLTWPQKLLEVSSDSSHFSGEGDDAMKYLVLNGLGQLLLCSLLSMILLMVFRFTVMDFIWMQEPSFFLKKWTKRKGTELWGTSLGNKSSFY